MLPARAAGPIAPKQACRAAFRVLLCARDIFPIFPAIEHAVRAVRPDNNLVQFLGEWIMATGKRLWVVVCCFLMLFMLAAAAFAGDPQTTAKDLKGISPKKYRYVFTTIGGAAVGMGIGKLLGGGPDVLKGMMIGGGGASALFLHSHPRSTLHGWRNWAIIGSYTSLGGGLGWTACGCNTGLVSGALIGGGGSAWYTALHGPSRTTTASTPTGP